MKDRFWRNFLKSFLTINYGHQKIFILREIDRDLEILKLQSEIHFPKIALSIKKTKENLSPKNILNEVVGSFKLLLSEWYITTLKFVISFIIKWIKT